jgi:FKBP-type peptidyl-prolyl cis-trans isomerase
MRFGSLAFVCAIALPSLVSAAEETLLATEVGRISYAIGCDLGRRFKQDGIEMDAKAFVAGMTDAMAGMPQMTDEQMTATLQQFQQNMKKRANDRKGKDAETNKAAAKTFLDQNAKRADVVVLPSGLQYEVVVAGGGPKPQATDTVSVHYRGTLLNGSEFDSSYGRGQPAQFSVNGVIKGWTEALQLMAVGAKWKLYIPPELGYGERGAGRDIGPNATLVFEVELLSIEGK